MNKHDKTVNHISVANQLHIDDVNELVSNVLGWAWERNITQEGTNSGQIKKLEEEFHELKSSLMDGQNPQDDIGDMAVVLIIIAALNGLTFGECLKHAWMDIKDRKGTMVKGVFIKNG